MQQVAKLQENEALERQGTRAPEGVRQTRKDNLSGWQWHQKPHHQRQGEYTGCHGELHQCRICLSWDLLGTWRRKDGTWMRSLDLHRVLYQGWGGFRDGRDRQGHGCGLQQGRGDRQEDVRRGGGPQR